MVKDYLLKENNSEWDKVAAKLVSAVPAADERNNRRKKYTTWLLVFLAGALSGGILITSNSGEQKQRTSNENASQNVVSATIGEENKSDQEQLPQNGNQKNEVGLKFNQDKVEQQLMQALNSKILVTRRTFNNKNLSQSTERNDASNNLEKISKENEIDFSRSIDFSDNNETRITKVEYVNPAIEETEEIVKESVIENKIKEKTVSKTSKNKGFYFGIVAGPSFSEVHGQGFKKTGFSGGIVSGYQFNKRLSFESGVMFSQKYYYSSGKYFNMEKMPASMNVISLEGESSLIEVPVKLRYYLSQGKRTNIYSAAGFSSYVLTNEKNDYLLLVNGVQQKMTSNYKNSYGYISATVDLSIGLEREINRKFQIRVEPYLKIPVRGIGIGSMQVMSTGLQIGLTRKAH